MRAASRVQGFCREFGCKVKGKKAWGLWYVWFTVSRVNRLE